MIAKSVKITAYIRDPMQKILSPASKIIFSVSNVNVSPAIVNCLTTQFTLFASASPFFTKYKSNVALRVSGFASFGTVRVRNHNCCNNAGFPWEL